MSELNLMFLQQ